MRTTCIRACLCLLLSTSLAQTPTFATQTGWFGLTRGSEWIRLRSTTGKGIELGNPRGFSLSPVGAALDDVGGRFFKLVFIDGRPHLLTIDAFTGANRGVEELERSIGDLRYDAATGRLLGVGVRILDDEGEIDVPGQLVEVDPETGDVDAIVTIGGEDVSFVIGGVALDPLTGVFYVQRIVAGARRITSVDSRSGVVIDDEPLSDTVVGLTHARLRSGGGTDSVLYGLRRDGFSTDYDLIRIDPRTGAETTLSSEGPMRLSPGAIADVDPDANEYVVFGRRGFWRFELPSGAPLGFEALEPVAAEDNTFDRSMVAVGYLPTCPVSSDVDADGDPDNDDDGLCDSWEVHGLDLNGDGTIDRRLWDLNGDGDTTDLSLGVTGVPESADPNVPDVYVSVDWMEKHEPLRTALADVVRAFRDRGVRLHVQVDEEVLPHEDQITFLKLDEDRSSDFFRTKGDELLTAAERLGLTAEQRQTLTRAKDKVFHYVLFLHGVDDESVLGLAELGGDDFVVTLGQLPPPTGSAVRGWFPWPAGAAVHPVGDRHQQAGTFMHELGHNLELRHGGQDDINCKPNYLSVMSYPRVLAVGTAGIPLDFSNRTLTVPDTTLGAGAAPTGLREAALDEAAGIGLPASVSGIRTRWSTRNKDGDVVYKLVNAAGPIDWNLDGDRTDTGLTLDLNMNPAPGSDDCQNTTAPQLLRGYEDWSVLEYRFRDTLSFGAARAFAPLIADESPISNVIAISADSDGDGSLDTVDLCPNVPDEGADADADGVGDACDLCPSTYDPEQRVDEASGQGVACLVTDVFGDLDGNGCVDRADYRILAGVVRSGDEGGDGYDLNDDGRLDRADLRTLVGAFDLPRGASCD